MDAKTINEKTKALWKATQSSESPSAIINILHELQKGVVASEELLRSTRVGIAVSKTKNHQNPEIARLANEIVRKWRDEVEKKRGGGSGAQTNGKKGPSRTASPAASGSQGSAKHGSPKGKAAHSPSALDPEKRGWKADGVNINRTGQSTRNNCIGLLYDGLVFMSRTPPGAVISVAITVETAVFDALGPEDQAPYKSKVRSLYQNLKNKSSAALRANVLDGTIPPDKFVHMNHDELKSSERREEDKKIEKENLRAAQAPQQEESISTSLQCSNCKQRKVAYTQAQTRSADEPMTTFCRCVNCGKRWKFS